MEGLWFKGVSDRPLVGTLPHGYYDDIALGADYYTGHLVLESPGQPQVTDLESVEPRVEEDEGWITISGAVLTPVGPVHKLLRVFYNLPRVELEYCLDWKMIPMGPLRVGHITLNPAAFERSTLFYRTHNGGCEEEMYPLAGTQVDHGNAVSFLVSARHGVGLSESVVELGDATHCLRIEIDKSLSALIGLMTYQEVGNTYFCRLAPSAGEMDETRHPMGDPVIRQMRIALTASRNERMCGAWTMGQRLPNKQNRSVNGEVQR